MPIAEEIDALKKVTEALDPLDTDARARVLEYALRAYSVKPPRAVDDPPTSKPLPHVIESTPGGKPLSPQEYLRDYGYKVMTKRIAVAAVFLERVRNQKRFALRDITQLFRDAKESKPPAQSQYIRAQVMGYLAKEGDQYYATSKAELLVDKYAPAIDEGTEE